MMTLSTEHLPVARKEGLLIERLSDEVLVYDLDRKKAHCLNLAAALIWDHCDGKTSVEEMTHILQKELNAPADKELVQFGLSSLEKNQLLREEAGRPADCHLTRRQLIRRVGLAVSVPLVISILAPQASAALSCVGTPCPQNTCPVNCTCIANVCQ